MLKNYRLLSGSYTQVIDGKEVFAMAGTSNDIVQLTPKMASRLGPKFQLIDGQEEQKVSPVEDNKAILEFLSNSPEEIEKTLPTMHDPVILAKIYNVEKASENPRQGVLEVIDARYDEVAEEHSRA